MKLCDKLISTKSYRHIIIFSYSQLFLTNYEEILYNQNKNKRIEFQFTIRTLGEAPLVIIFEIITENWEADKSIVTRNIRLQRSVKMEKNVKYCGIKIKMKLKSTFSIILFNLETEHIRFSIYER